MARRVKGAPPEGLRLWLDLILKYVVGGGGCIYEALVDKLQHPTALVVFGGIAGLTNVLEYHIATRQELKNERSKGSGGPT